MLALALPSGADQPSLFNEGGYRTGQYRAPVPDRAGDAETIDIDQLRDRIAQGWVALDVTGAQHFDIDDLGNWTLPQPHLSLPGAHWLPVVGWGDLQRWQQDYLADSLTRITGGDHEAGVAVFCKVDCWLSWNAARRIMAMGYRNVAWFPGGNRPLGR